MVKYRYSDEDLAKAVAESFSVMEVMRKLGIKIAGGSHTHISNRIKNSALSTKHFLGQNHNKGKVSTNRKSAAEILVLKDKDSRRENVTRLRRALDEIGRERICVECSVDEVYNGKSLVLEIDHINGNSWDDRPENLRWLCPNCHSQQDNGKPWRFAKR